jgi:hypothetical protein
MYSLVCTANAELVIKLVAKAIVLDEFAARFCSIVDEDRQNFG